MWTARADAELDVLPTILETARDQGVQHVDDIAAREAPLLGISEQLSRTYLRESLHFQLGRNELAGLRLFYEHCVAHGLAPAGLNVLPSFAGKANTSRH